MNLNRLLGIEIYIVHVGHFLLFLGALVILALNVPWWAVLVAAPLVGLGVLGWLYEASIVLPAARQLLSQPSEAATAGSPAGSNDPQPEPKD
jgi:hypothetical protein